MGPISMQKPQSLFRTSFVMLASILQLCCSCSSNPPASREPPFERATQKLQASRSFRETFPGPITDLSLAEKVGRVLASSIPDPESGGKHLLTLLDKGGG